MEGWFVGGIFVLVILCVVFGPFLMIWSVNTLFGLTIPFTLKTWFAALILGGSLSARRASKS